MTESTALRERFCRLFHFNQEDAAEIPIEEIKEMLQEYDVESDRMGIAREK